LLTALVVFLAWGLTAPLGAALLRLQGVDELTRSSPLSTITLAIVLGLILGNVLRIPLLFRPGFAFATRRLLRLGIVLVGIRLSLGDVAALGAIGIPVVIVLITVALIGIPMLAPLFGVSSRFAILTAAATSICGVTAAVATAPVVQADEQELTYTIANVTLFGLLGMLLYPYAAHFFFADLPMAAGLFLGTSIHDTSQVMGAALSYRELFADEVAFKVATVTKLTRNVFIAAVVPILGILYARSAAAGGRRPRIRELLPLFVLGFVAMALVRTAGDMTLAAGGRALGLFAAESWRMLLTLLGDQASYLLLAAAMAAVGLSTDFRKLRALGLRPFWLGAAAALLVALTGLLLAYAVALIVG
jgi:uncharacterized integral membrane protein (TIGR00698 family)